MQFHITEPIADSYVDPGYGRVEHVGQSARVVAKDFRATLDLITARSHGEDFASLSVFAATAARVTTHVRADTVSLVIGDPGTGLRLTLSEDQARALAAELAVLGLTNRS